MGILKVLLISGDFPWGRPHVSFKGGICCRPRGQTGGPDDNATWRTAGKA